MKNYSSKQEPSTLSLNKQDSKRKVIHQILINYAITCSKESQHMRYEVPLIWLQIIPVYQILG